MLASSALTSGRSPPSEVDALADAVPPRYRALVLLAAWCSLRLGELAALTRADLDLLHGKAKVTKNCSGSMTARSSW